MAMCKSQSDKRW